MPAASARSLAFTLWLKSADFRARAAEAAELVRQVLADNPHTTLQVVLEPAGDPRHLTAEVLETLLAASHESLSYLDWFYSLHPVRLLGAKRLVVLLPAAMEELLDEAGSTKSKTGRRSTGPVIGERIASGGLRSENGPTLSR